MRDLKLPQSDMHEFFRRMVFNVISVNQDDHTKNISFLMDQSGTWYLSPAYDITYCNGGGWTKQHQMTINGKRKNFELEDLLSVATHADISKGKAVKIIKEVTTSVRKWQEFAEKSGLTAYIENETSLASWVNDIEKQHRLTFV